MTAVRVEWCKAWARSRRWTEEVMLLREEMRRVIAYHEHKAEWWKQRRNGDGCQWPSADHAEGACAYTSEHAAMHKDLIARCVLVWSQDSRNSSTGVVGVVQELRAGDLFNGDTHLDSDNEDIVEDVDIDNLI
jgi:hypothetical protein